MPRPAPGVGARVRRAWSPNYFPQQLFRQAHSLLRGQVLFGSYFRVLTPDRWLGEFAGLEIKDEVRPLLQKENALGVSVWRLGLDQVPTLARASRAVGFGEARAQSGIGGDHDQMAFPGPWNQTPWPLGSVSVASPPCTRVFLKVRVRIRPSPKTGTSQLKIGSKLSA